jgi:hypothetical protein
VIRKRLIQGWIGPKPMPEELAGYCAEMKRMNPEFEYHLFRNEIMERYGNDPYVKHMISRQLPWAFVVDRIRLLLLRDEGGIWIDPDAKPLKPLSTLPIWDRADLDFCTGLRDPYRPGVALHRGVSFCDNTVLASASNGRIVNLILNGYSASRPVLNGHDAGCIAMTNTRDDVLFLGYKYFYALERHPESVLLHDGINLASWCVSKPLQFANA